ncbi:MAG: hypothetical protein RBG13Loki_1429 [Promethearchaeota archaeon CR_4]|nr:MAG: hypothetical protein RBG13Loki_1429 [Candidatus Lokiarchaeota archaeon CR_4]
MSPRQAPRRYYSKPLVIYYPPKYINPIYSASWSQKWMMILPAWIKKYSSKVERQNFSYYNYSNARCDTTSGCLTIRDQKFVITITSELMPDSTWEEIAAKFSKKALWEGYLKGDYLNYALIPPFVKVVESLVPQSFSSLKIKCSCQEEKKINQDLCAHVRQAWNVVASQIENNPWLLFQFRGRTRKQILEMIHQNRSRKILQQHKNLKNTVPVTAGTQLLPVEGNWDAAFWQSEVPLKSPFADQSSTEIEMEENVLQHKKGDPILIGEYDMGRVIAEYFKQLPTNIEKGIQDIAATVATFPPVQVALKQDMEAVLTRLKENKKPLPAPQVLPQEPPLIKREIPLLQQQSITESKVALEIPREGVLTTETQKIPDSKKPDGCTVPRVKPRSFVEGDTQLYHIRIDQSNQSVDQSKQRIIEIHPLSSLQDLGRALLKAEYMPPSNKFEFYDLHTAPSTFSLSVSEGQLTLPANIPPISNADQIKLKDVLPREGERMLFRPDVQKFSFNLIELYHICLRHTQTTETINIPENVTSLKKAQFSHSFGEKIHHTCSSRLTISKILDNFYAEQEDKGDFDISKTKSILRDYQDYLEKYGPGYLGEGEGTVNPLGFKVFRSTPLEKSFCMSNGLTMLSIIGFAEYFDTYFFKDPTASMGDLQLKVRVIRKIANWLQEKGYLAAKDYDEALCDFKTFEEIFTDEDIAIVGEK